MKRLVSFLSLFTSVGTLLCCALPALFVVLGLGAAFAGLVGAFPQLISISEHKTWVFGLGALLLIAGGGLQWKARTLSCPIDSKLGYDCQTTRDWSVWAYGTSVFLYLLGASFAYLPGFLA